MEKIRSDMFMILAVFLASFSEALAAVDDKIMEIESLLIFMPSLGSIRLWDSWGRPICGDAADDA